MIRANRLLRLAMGFLIVGVATGSGQCAAWPDAFPGQDQGPPRTRPRDESRSKPLFGKVTAIKDSSMEILKPNGEVVTVGLSDKTEFRKDQQNAKLSDFKVGDVVFVRGEENSDHTVTAQMVGSRSAGGPGGPAGGPMGTLGKDFVVGEIKQLDPPRITILRVDNVTQTVEINEETSIRKGRESITLPDIHVGDHVMARGAAHGDAFVPKSLVVISPEQWQRMQEMGFGGASPANPPVSAPDGSPKTSIPPESQD
jgi:hypothetical protein